MHAAAYSQVLPLHILADIAYDAAYSEVQLEINQCIQLLSDSPTLRTKRCTCMQRAHTADRPTSPVHTLIQLQT